MTASGGNFIGSEVNRSKRAPQWGVATTEVAERTCMTLAEFTAFYPQFTGFTPAVVMTEYIRQANARFSAFVPEDALNSFNFSVKTRVFKFSGDVTVIIFLCIKLS